MPAALVAAAGGSARRGAGAVLCGALQRAAGLSRHAAFQVIHCINASSFFNGQSIETEKYYLIGNVIAYVLLFFDTISIICENKVSKFLFKRCDVYKSKIASRWPFEYYGNDLLFI